MLLRLTKSKFNLHDISEWDHFINNVLRGWVVSGLKPEMKEIASNTIKDLLISPLWEYIQMQHEKVPNSTLVLSGINLVNYLDFDIAQRFRNNQVVMIDQLDTLNNLIKEFLAICSSSSILANSVKQSHKAKLPRKKGKPTKNDLNKFKEKYIYENAKERGWIKSASNFYSISPSTIRRIFNNNAP